MTVMYYYDWDRNVLVCWGGRSMKGAAFGVFGPSLGFISVEEQNLEASKKASSSSSASCATRGEWKYPVAFPTTYLCLLFEYHDCEM